MAPPPGAAPAGSQFIRNRFIGTVDAVAANGRVVFGVRLAPTPETAVRWLERLHSVVGGLTFTEIEPPTAAEVPPATDGYAK